MNMQVGATGGALPTTLTNGSGQQESIKDMSSDKLTERLNSGTLSPKETAACALELMNRAKKAEDAGQTPPAGSPSMEGLDDDQKEKLKKLLEKLASGKPLSDEERAELKNLLKETGMSDKAIDGIVPPKPNEI